jgi:trehalose/maltose hydrolase-like predicted phosphorylase
LSHGAHKKSIQSATERAFLAAFERIRQDPAWCQRQDGYDRTRELQVESRFAVSNGALGVRGSLEFPTDVSGPRTYVAGLYDLSVGEPAVPTLVSAPEWVRLELSVDGEEVDLTHGESIALTRTLDMRHGLLGTEWQHRTSQGHTVRLRGLRFISLVERNLAMHAAHIEITPARGAKPRVRLTARIPAPVGMLRPDHVDRDLRVCQTTTEGQRLAMAWAPRLEIGGHTRKPRPEPIQAGKPGEHADDELVRHWEWTAATGQAATLIRPVAIVAERDERDPAVLARAIIRRARAQGLPRLLQAHCQAWEARWAESDIEVQGDAYAQAGLRFATYQLNAAANPDDERVSIGARALTGDAYAGRVFWETEIYLLPFYLATYPAAARAALLYRYYTLPAARAKARRLGYGGAFYAWESANTGEDATPPMVFNERHEPILINNGTQEQHISADVAWAVWQYWQATGDDAFLREAGAEIILDTARFWASRLEEGPDHRLHIRTVIGPDEYHENVDDNAYTNAMAQWNLERGLEIAELFASRYPGDWTTLRKRLRLTRAELRQWQTIAPRIALDLDPAGGVVEQFAGYGQLEPLRVADYAPRTAPMDVILGLERTRRSQVVKQPDVVMLMALLPERMADDVKRASFRYYEQRCGHGSSLSPSIHALVAARLGEQAYAERYFREAAAIDLDDAMGNAAGGVHIGGLAGLWQAAVFGFAGMRSDSHGLTFDPRLPASWRTLQFPVQWRGRHARFACDAAAQTITITLEQGGPLPVRIGDVHHVLEHGESWTAPWPSAAGQATQQAA